LSHLPLKFRLSPMFPHFPNFRLMPMFLQSLKFLKNL
jgi:hypothetical protein